MEKYTLEMNYGLNITLNVEADSQEEAIEKAKEVIGNGVDITEDYRIKDVSELFFQDVNYISKENR
jgi:hypothetical protein